MESDKNVGCVFKVKWNSTTAAEIEIMVLQMHRSDFAQLVAKSLTRHSYQDVTGKNTLLVVKLAISFASIVVCH